MLKLRSILLGGAEFATGEEYAQFRFQILFFSLIAGVGLCGSLLLGHWSGVREINHIRFIAIGTMLLTDIVLLVLLWGQKNRLTFVAGVLFAVWFPVNLAVLWAAPEDEFRLIYFFLQVACVYTILGVLPGFVMALLTLAVITVMNGYLPGPYSPRAVGTAIASLCVTSVFLHVFVQRLVGFHRRLTEANRQLQDLSRHDPLTGVMNARAFYETCDQLIRQALRSGSPFAVLFLDLDHFKSINDQYGHEAGDGVLKAVADCLVRSTRSTDALGRIGGEEFMLLLPHTNLLGATVLAEKLRQNVETLMPSVGPARIPLTISIGVAANQSSRELIVDIKQRADRAMYRAKAAGRNRVMSFEDI